MDNLPWFRSLSWYFLIASNYFFYGETLVEQFGVVINRVDFLPVLVKYHRLISFSMYIMGKNHDYYQMILLIKIWSGFVWFVLSLVKKYYLRQFSLFAWTHVALLCVVSQSYLIIQNMFQVARRLMKHGFNWLLYYAGPHLVYYAHNDGYYQRCDGLHVWFLHGQNSSD